MGVLQMKCSHLFKFKSAKVDNTLVHAAESKSVSGGHSGSEVLNLFYLLIYTSEKMSLIPDSGIKRRKL